MHLLIIIAWKSTFRHLFYYTLFSFSWKLWMTILPHVKSSGCPSIIQNSRRWVILASFSHKVASWVWIHVDGNICVGACWCVFTGRVFYFCTESVREQSAFEVLCFSNIGCIQAGKALIITISLWDCSVMLPKLERERGRGGGSWSCYTLTLYADAHRLYDSRSG